MSAETNLGLVKRPFRDLHPDFGALMDHVIGVDGSGYIPLEAPFEILEQRVLSRGYKMSPLPDSQGEIIQRVIVVEPIDKEQNFPWTVICEIDGGLWVSNSDFDDFRRIFLDESMVQGAAVS